MRRLKFKHAYGSERVFGERVSQKTSRGLKFAPITQPRWLVFLVLVVLCFLFGVARLTDLQIIRGSYFRTLADGNRVRRIPIRAPRGDILDRNNIAMARNLPAYKLATFSSGGVVTEVQKISRERALAIQSSKPDLESRLITDIEREYPYGASAAHLIGYVNEVSNTEVGNTNQSCPDSPIYRAGNLIGRGGIEAQYECMLRGRDGEELVEVDTQGKIVRRLGRREPIAGDNVVLSIDSSLQSKAYEAMLNTALLTKAANGGVGWEGGERVRGAFVAQDATNGAILALVSVPSFDPTHIFDQYTQVSQDESLPLFNRAIGGAYHPGSAFKLVTSIAGLSDGQIDSSFEYTDEGFIKVNDFSYSNWYFTQYGRTEGKISLVRAISRSTDTLFYKVGEMVGPDRIAHWAGVLGYGSKTGIDLPGEIGGLLPTTDWKLKYKGERWYLGNTYHFAIGQGDLTATPLQVNQVTVILANGGRLCRPTLAGGELRGLGGECEDLGIKTEHINLVLQGMVGACSAGGTAFPFFGWNEKLAVGQKIGCKTGTAQTVGDGKTHAWFTAYVPAREEGVPVAVTVLVEEGGEGSRVAAPVVYEVLSGWLGRN